MLLGSVTIVVGVLGAAMTQTRQIPLDSGWTLSGEGTRIEDHRGAPSIKIRTGRAIRRDVALQDGTIEFDMSVTPHRSFVYLQFRMEDDANYEEIYFRPHKSSLPDAVQYAPVWNSESNWQLYHGKTGTAAVPLARDEWIRVRLVLAGQRAAVFVGAEPTPDMVVRLARPPRAGYIALRSFVPAGGAPDGVVAATFANVTVRDGHVPYDFGPPVRDTTAAGLVTRWQISPAFATAPGAVTRLPDSILASRARWQSIAAEPNGIAVMGRHVKRPAPQSAVIARLVLRATADGVQRMDLGYSDYVTVFANGRPLFAGDAHYSFDEPRQEGVIGLFQSMVWLPVVRGDNEILLAVADGFGGWGLTARLEPTAGISVVPPPR
jgi:hypothetical protein